MTACAPSQGRDFCPSASDLTPQYLALLPRGRAWGENGAGRLPGGGLYGFVYALAIRMAAVHAAICALVDEFFCATADAALDLWDADYGLPDGCDAYANLCAKVAAQGGATCAYYTAVAAALGWSIDCAGPCAPEVGYREAGMTVGPSVSAATLGVVVFTALSPAYTGVQAIGKVMGCYEMGMPASCGPDLTALDCVLQRIVGAHVAITYTLV